MLTEIMAYLHNFFLVEGAVRTGTFKVRNGSLNLPFLMDGQYFLIEGSVFNDGVHQYGNNDLKDEIFTGDIAPMSVPEAFLNLCNDIADWQETNGAKATSPYQSESFGGYSYTRASGKDGASISWKTAFASRLNTWRKI